MNIIGYVILTFVFVALIVFYVKYLKKIRCGNMICITGGIKTGKSTLSVRQATQLLFSQRLKVWVYNYIIRFGCYPFYCWFRRFKLLDKKDRPLLYSNIPLRIPYVPITEELLKREEKPVPRSVAYICEASLVADSMSYKDPIMNEELLLFNKLWGHASKGGYLIYDTQSITDNHYAIKRCLNTYLYIHHAIKIPFFVIMFIREERYSEDKQTINTYGEDVEKTMMIHLVPKKTWKLFDCYCYSVLTDNLPCATKNDEVIIKKRQDLKARKIVSFKDYFTIQKENKK